MHRRNWLVLLSLALVVGLLSAGCQATPAAPTAAPEEPTEAPAAAPTEAPAPEPTEEPAPEGGDEVVVTVNDVPFTMNDLQALEQVTIETKHPSKDEMREYTGVRIQDLLDAAGVAGGTLTLVGGDGYEAQVPTASLTGESLLAYRDKGGLRAVVPGMGEGAWVKGVVEVQWSSEEIAACPVEVHDALDRTVEFDELPQRIVLPGKGIWMIGHTLYLFPEAAERVVAMEQRGTSVSDFIPLIDPTFNDKPVLEEDAAPEQIAPFNPDAVILKSYTAERLGAPLEQLGMSVVYVELETPDQFFRDVGTLGQLFGNEAKAQEIKDYYQGKLDAIAQGLEGLSDDEKPRVLVIQYNARSAEVAFQVPPMSWMQSLQVETAGGAPVWAEAAEGGGWALVNLEQIAAWNPDIIFAIAFKADPDELVAQLKADPKWQALQAVQNGTLYGFPSDLYGWDVPDPRWILGMTWAATKVHPDRFADVDMMQEVYEFYEQMYGMDQAAVDKHIVPHLKGNYQ